MAIQFADFGNALLAGSGAAYQQGRSRREAEADRMRKDAQQYIEPALRGDQGAFGKLAAGSPETASSVATMLGRMDASQRAKAKDAAEYTANAANAILQADPASRPMVYRQMREDGIRRGFNLDSLPPEYNPGMDGLLRSQRSMAIPILEQMKIEENRPTPLGDGPAPVAGGGPRDAISRVESGGRYDAVGPVANDKGNRAYGKYQVMDFNVGPWTQEILGKAMTPQEFLANPQAQDAVFDGKFGQYVQKYGSPGAASRAWFAGEGGMNNPNAKDVLGTTVAGYEQKFNAGMPQGAAPGQPGPIAQPPQVAQGGDMPQADGSGTPMAPGGVRITPEAQLQPEVRSVREIVRATRPGFRVMITPKTGLPIYDSQGRLYVQGPNGEPDYIEIPKMPTAPSGFRPTAGGRLEPIPGGPADKPQGSGPFPGQSVEANALNMLIANGTLTQQQAAELAAGKTVVNPADGSIVFMTPSGIFGRPQGGEVQPLTPTPAQAPAQAPAPPPTSLKLPPMPGAAPPAAAPPAAQPGMIPITPPKPQQMTEGQANAALYADRMRKADTIIQSVGSAGLDVKGKLLEKVPFGAGNFMQEDNYQLYEQARRDFINAVLRRESGAVISDAEFENAERQYFPRPGDSPVVLKQKADNRQTAIDGISRAAGNTYKPSAPSGGGPKPGTIEEGYRFKGGDPAKQENWERVQ
jgi:hypothetical protein